MSQNSSNIFSPVPSDRKLLINIFKENSISYTDGMTFLEQEKRDIYYLESINQDLYKRIVTHFSNIEPIITNATLQHGEAEWTYVDDNQSSPTIDYIRYFKKLFGPIFPKMRRKTINGNRHIEFSKFGKIKFNKNQIKSIKKFADEKLELLKNEIDRLDNDTLSDKTIIPIIKSFKTQWLQEQNITFIDADENSGMILKCWGIEPKYMAEYLHDSFEEKKEIGIPKWKKIKFELQEDYFDKKNKIYDEHKGALYETLIKEKLLVAKVEAFHGNEEFKKITKAEVEYLSDKIEENREFPLKDQIALFKKLHSDPFYYDIKFSQIAKSYKSLFICGGITIVLFCCSAAFGLIFISIILAIASFLLFVAASGKAGDLETFRGYRLKRWILS